MYYLWYIKIWYKKRHVNISARIEIVRNSCMNYTIQFHKLLSNTVHEYSQEII